MFSLFRKSTLTTRVEDVYYTNIDVPNGTFVKDNLSSYFFITSSKKYLIPSERVLRSWAPPTIALSHSSNLEKYPNGGRLGFRNGVVIEDILDNSKYLISDNKRRMIVSPDILDFLGYSFYDILMVSHEEAQLHTLGDDIG